MANFTEEQLNRMLQAASKQMSTTPAELKQKLKNNDLQLLLRGMSRTDAAKVEQILGDSALTKRLLATPQAQEILQKLMKESR